MEEPQCRKRRTSRLKGAGPCSNNRFPLSALNSNNELGKQTMLLTYLTKTKLNRRPRSQPIRQAWRNGLALCAVVAGLGAATQHSKAITLPIEVFGTASGGASVRFFAPPSSDNTPITTLVMRVHGVEYPGEASVRVNNGTWIPLDNQHVTILGPGIAGDFGGIGGSPISTFDLSIPLPADDIPKVGAVNLISFRFNQTNGINSGWRVLNFNFRHADGSNVLPASMFTQDDPSTWKPPLNDPADIAAGQALWQNATLKLNSLPGAPTIKAHCGDCHATDGRDLKYFNYSNYSIIVRCMFHGLSYQQGEQIASYIRSLPASYGSKYARPWNPPYQPGPGLDSHGAQEWAAGAGIDAVLPNDAAMLPYLFPNGINAQATSVHGYLNMRELPIDMPLLDWNHWLPTMSPVDYTVNFYAPANTTSPFVTSWSGRYFRILNNLQNNFNHYLSKPLGGTRPDGAPLMTSDFKTDQDAWTTGKLTWLPQLASDVTTDQQKAEVIYSLAQWRMVRAWEIQQRFGLDTMGKAIFTNIGSSSNDRIEPLTWSNAFAFDTSSKALHIEDGALRDANGNKLLSQPTPLGGSWAGNQYLNDAWYWMQLILNPGNGKGYGNVPVDWGYIPAVIAGTGRVTGESQWLRVVALIIKGSQERDNGIGYVMNTRWDSNDPGWNPWRVDSIFFVMYLQNWGKTTLSQALQSQIVDAMIQSWLAKNEEYTVSQWFTPWQTPQAQHWDPSMNPNALPVWYSNTFEGQVYTWLSGAKKAGVSDHTLIRVVKWLQTMWPRVDWAVVAFQPEKLGHDHSHVPLIPEEAASQ